MKPNWQQQTFTHQISLSPKIQSPKVENSQLDLQNQLLRSLTKKKSFQSSMKTKIRKAGYIPTGSFVNSFSQQNELLKLITIQSGSKMQKKNLNISQQQLSTANRFKTEINEVLNQQESLHRQKSYSPLPKGYIDPGWLNKIPQPNKTFIKLGQGRQTPGSLASTEIDPMSLYKGQQGDKIQIILDLGDQKHQYHVDPIKTTSWLEAFLIKETKQHQPNLSPVSFVSVDKDLNIDFFLQSRDRSLTALRNRTLTIKPYCPQNNRKGNISLKDFLFIKCIGVGGFSRVYLVKRLQTGRFYAMKLIDKEFVIKKKTEGIVQNERDIMAVVDHPFLVKLEYAFEHRNFLVFVLEFCSGGELFQQLKRVKKMTEDQAKYYFGEVCLGIYFLHQLNICYRDVKPENILLDAEGHVRIADFGLSKPNMSERDVAYSFCGSPEYMAPEMLKKEGHTLAVDNYCLGVLLYELVTGLPPFYSKDINKIYASILNDPVTFPSNVELSKELKDLLVRLLAKNPGNRIGSKDGLAEVLVHPWFGNLSMTALLEKKIPPPFVPDPLKFYFHLHDNTKGTGEIETIDKLLGRTGLTKDIKVFDQFYFDRNQENSIKSEQALFYKHYKLIIGTHEQKAQNQTKKEAKHFSIDTSKCGFVLGKLQQPQVCKSPTSTMVMNSTKRHASKNFVLSSPHNPNLKKSISSLFYTDRLKAANNSQQMDQFLHGKLSQSINKTTIQNEKFIRRGSSQQKISQSKNEF